MLRDNGQRSTRNIAFTLEKPIPVVEHYMEQLEEVIEQKNEKIAILTNQLETLTASQKDESGPADVGSLQRQLIKMEQSMKVQYTHQ